MDKTRGNLPLTITLGALWGLLEATAGGGMHVGHLPYGSLLLFPIGAAWMLSGVYRAGRSGIALEIAAAAALIKLTNLRIPGYFPMYYVLNPALAIGWEGARVCLFSRMFAWAGGQWPISSYVRRWSAASGLLPAVFLHFWGWLEIMSARTVLTPASERGFFASPLARRFRRIGPVSLFLVAILVNHFTL